MMSATSSASNPRVASTEQRYGVRPSNGTVKHKCKELKASIKSKTEDAETVEARLKETEQQLAIKDKEIIAVKSQLEQTGSESQNELKSKIEEVSKLSMQAAEREAEKEPILSLRLSMSEAPDGLLLGADSLLLIEETAAFVSSFFITSLTVVPP